MCVESPGEKVCYNNINIVKNLRPLPYFDVVILVFKYFFQIFLLQPKKGVHAGSIFLPWNVDILPRHRASSGCRWRMRPRDIESGCKYIKRRHRTADRHDSAGWGFCEKRKAHRRREVTIYQTDERGSDFEKSFVTT